MGGIKILAVETAGENCSAALLFGDEVEQRLASEPRRHAELLLGMIDELLGWAGITVRELDALAFGRGPGSFTGVRIATSVAQGVAFAADLPVVPVSTLAALAQGHFRSTASRRILSAFDARMGELYWGPCQVGAAGVVQPAGPEEVASPDAVSIPDGNGWIGIGGGWAAHGGRLRERLGSRLVTALPDVRCESRDVAFLAAAALESGQYVSAEHALPLYLRDRVAEEP